jgi:hypothetical protein
VCVGARTKESADSTDRHNLDGPGPGSVREGARGHGCRRIRSARCFFVHADLLNGDHIQPSCSAEKVYAVLHRSGDNQLQKLLAANQIVLGKGKGQGPCFKVKFADGYAHPGVPYAHIRRLEQA